MLYSILFQIDFAVFDDDPVRLKAAFLRFHAAKGILPAQFSLGIHYLVARILIPIRIHVQGISHRSRPSAISKQFRKSAVGDYLSSGNTAQKRINLLLIKSHYCSKSDLVLMMALRELVAMK